MMHKACCAVYATLYLICKVTKKTVQLLCQRDIKVKRPFFSLSCQVELAYFDVSMFVVFKLFVNL